MKQIMIINDPFKCTIEDRLKDFVLEPGYRRLINRKILLYFYEKLNLKDYMQENETIEHMTNAHLATKINLFFLENHYKEIIMWNEGRRFWFTGEMWRILEGKHLKSDRVYYKVVSKDGDYYRSCFNFDYDSSVKYSKNKYVHANEKYYNMGYHLLVFDKEINAVNFVNMFTANDYFIFKCRVKGVVKNIPYRLINMVDLKTINKDGWRKGTVMAKKVMIYGKPIQI